MTTNPVPTAHRNRRAVAAVTALLLILAAQVVNAVRGQSLTWDEGDHIFSGYESWKTHDFGLNPEHPPMVKMLATLPLHLTVPPLQHRFFKTEAYNRAATTINTMDPDARTQWLTTIHKNLALL